MDQVAGPTWQTTREVVRADARPRSEGCAPARVVRLVAALIVASALAAAFSPSAFAHSVLIGTQPGNDVVVPESPNEVVLEFNEPVDTSLGSLRVFDGQGQQVDSGDVSQPAATEVAVALESELAPGTYTVAWRVVSADSDPISGAFVFHVLERGVGAANVSIDTLTGTSAVVDILFTAGRFFDLALLLLVVGGSASLVGALPSAEWRVRRRLYGILAALAGALALVALANILLQGAAAGGLALVDAISWSLYSTVIETRYGEVILIQSALAATLALTALALRHSEGRDRRALVGLTLALCAGLSVTPSFSGHASTLGALGLTADVIHVVSAAMWTGGLAFLLLALWLAGAQRWQLATDAVPRFSTMAVLSVVALITAGIVSGYLQVRTWSGLWETEYGLLLLAKIVLVLPLLALGAYNNRYAVPRLKAGIASVLERRRFLRVTAVELGIMVAIVSVTAVLINAEPARTELEMAEGEHTTIPDDTMTDAGHEPFAGSVKLGDMQATVVVDPAMPGENTIIITFAPSAEMPSEVSVSASLPSQEIGPLDFEAKPDPAESGAWVIEDASLSIAGDWELRVQALMGEFDLRTETITVPIQGS